ncbi:TPA: hypothetical protein F8R96_13245 [Legionella pneumophila]|nr:hypothetical protein [Legionella pneumophila]HBC0466459.1 hypothetical protein [Legionella pneumophila]HBI2947525.1 hypothetical protein [Legionella pneumophila]HDV6631288.1 hypothetical protein [Legionella pneumophila]
MFHSATEFYDWFKKYSPLYPIIFNNYRITRRLNVDENYNGIIYFLADDNNTKVVLKIIDLHDVNNAHQFIEDLKAQFNDSSDATVKIHEIFQSNGNECLVVVEEYLPTFISLKKHVENLAIKFSEKEKQELLMSEKDALCILQKIITCLLDLSQNESLNEKDNRQAPLFDISDLYINPQTFEVKFSRSSLYSAQPPLARIQIYPELGCIGLVDDCNESNQFDNNSSFLTGCLLIYLLTGGTQNSRLESFREIRVIDNDYRKILASDSISPHTKKMLKEILSQDSSHLISLRELVAKYPPLNKEMTPMLKSFVSAYLDRASYLSMLPKDIFKQAVHFTGTRPFFSEKEVNDMVDTEITEQTSLRNKN